MSTRSLVAALALCAALTAVNGCKKQETPPASQTPTSTGTTSTLTAKTLDEAKEGAKQVADQATAAAKEAAQKAQDLIDRAKTLFAETNYSEALNTLNQLVNVKLTPEQKRVVDDLKTKIQSALATAATTGATSALGGVLEPKK